MNKILTILLAMVISAPTPVTEKSSPLKMFDPGSTSTIGAPYTSTPSITIFEDFSSTDVLQTFKDPKACIGLLIGLFVTIMMVYHFTVGLSWISNTADKPFVLNVPRNSDHGVCFWATATGTAAVLIGSAGTYYARDYPAVSAQRSRVRGLFSTLNSRVRGLFSTLNSRVRGLFSTNLSRFRRLFSSLNFGEESTGRLPTICSAGERKRFVILSGTNAANLFLSEVRRGQQALVNCMQPDDKVLLALKELIEKLKTTQKLFNHVQITASMASNLCKIRDKRERRRELEDPARTAGLNSMTDVSVSMVNPSALALNAMAEKYKAYSGVVHAHHGITVQGDPTDQIIKNPTHFKMNSHVISFMCCETEHPEKDAYVVQLVEGLKQISTTVDDINKTLKRACIKATDLCEYARQLAVPLTLEDQALVVDMKTQLIRS